MFTILVYRERKAVTKPGMQPSYYEVKALLRL